MRSWVGKEMGWIREEKVGELWSEYTAWKHNYWKGKLGVCVPPVITESWEEEKRKSLDLSASSLALGPGRDSVSSE